jgi:hypothetical protein
VRDLRLEEHILNVVRYPGSDDDQISVHSNREVLGSGSLAQLVYRGYVLYVQEPIYLPTYAPPPGWSWRERRRRPCTKRPVWAATAKGRRITEFFVMIQVHGKGFPSYKNKGQLFIPSRAAWRFLGLDSKSQATCKGPLSLQGL